MKVHKLTIVHCLFDFNSRYAASGSVGEGKNKLRIAFRIDLVTPVKSLDEVPVEFKVAAVNKIFKWAEPLLL